MVAEQVNDQEDIPTEAQKRSLAESDTIGDEDDAPAAKRPRLPENIELEDQTGAARVGGTNDGQGDGALEDGTPGKRRKGRPGTSAASKVTTPNAVRARQSTPLKKPAVSGPLSAPEQSQTPTGPPLDEVRQNLSATREAEVGRLATLVRTLKQRKRQSQQDAAAAASDGNLDGSSAIPPVGESDVMELAAEITRSAEGIRKLEETHSKLLDAQEQLLDAHKKILRAASKGKEPLASDSGASGGDLAAANLAAEYREMQRRSDELKEASRKLRMETKTLGEKLERLAATYASATGSPDSVRSSSPRPDYGLGPPIEPADLEAMNAVGMALMPPFAFEFRNGGRGRGRGRSSSRGRGRGTLLSVQRRTANGEEGDGGEDEDEDELASGAEEIGEDGQLKKKRGRGRPRKEEEVDENGNPTPKPKPKRKPKVKAEGGTTSADSILGNGDESAEGHGGEGFDGGDGGGVSNEDRARRGSAPKKSIKKKREGEEGFEMPNEPVDLATFPPGSGPIGPIPHTLSNGEVIEMHFCSFCHKGFGRRADATRHEKIHRDDRAYICNFVVRNSNVPDENIVCGKRFIQRHALVVHERTHTGERPYKCDNCGVGFVDSSSLARHLRSHTGVRPYRCSNCEKGFTRRSTLHKHMISTHDTSGWRQDMEGGEGESGGGGDAASYDEALTALLNDTTRMMQSGVPLDPSMLRFAALPGMENMAGVVNGMVAGGQQEHENDAPAMMEEEQGAHKAGEDNES
ncbi:hypothetical protein HDU93_001117 [Gonapodya sp. JEL0774]|nr:hypothetical protein HDU93_001117 [Gonapodya sp. JEL0774]